MATTRSVTLYLDYTSIDILDYTECPAKNSLYKASFGMMLPKSFGICYRNRRHLLRLFNGKRYEFIDVSRWSHSQFAADCYLLRDVTTSTSASFHVFFHLLCPPLIWRPLKRARLRLRYATGVRVREIGSPRFPFEFNSQKLSVSLCLLLF